jgi:hypothetical protein
MILRLRIIANALIEDKPRMQFRGIRSFSAAGELLDKQIIGYAEIISSILRVICGAY